MGTEPGLVTIWNFTKAIADAVSLPVVASGGAGTLEHFYEAVVKGAPRFYSLPRFFTIAP